MAYAEAQGRKEVAIFLEQKINEIKGERDGDEFGEAAGADDTGKDVGFNPLLDSGLDGGKCGRGRPRTRRLLVLCLLTLAVQTQARHLTPLGLTAAHTHWWHGGRLCSLLEGTFYQLDRTGSELSITPNI